MKVWIDQDLCTGDGLCEEIAPDVFTLLDDETCPEDPVDLLWMPAHSKELALARFDVISHGARL